jgi:hypothetical protein
MAPSVASSVIDLISSEDDDDGPLESDTDYISDGFLSSSDEEDRQDHETEKEADGQKAEEALDEADEAEEACEEMTEDNATEEEFAKREAEIKALKAEREGREDGWFHYLLRKFPCGASEEAIEKALQDAANDENGRTSFS